MPPKDDLNSELLWKTAIFGVVSFLLVYAISILSRPTISPEIAIAFLIVDGVKSMGQMLHQFFVFNWIWYRPLTFYLTNYLIFHSIDIHNIYLIKIISMFVILLNGYIVSELSKRIFDSSFIERVIVFSLVVSHPIYYSMAYEGSGISDPIFNIFINLFLICFIGLWEDLNPKLVNLEKLESRDKLPLVVLCFFFILCIVTSHERGLAVFAMVGALTIFYQWDYLRLGRIKWEKATAAVVAFSALVFVLYMLVVYRSKSHMTGDHYRTTFEITYVLQNLIKSIELPLRLFVHKDGSHYESHYDPLFNLFAFPFLLALLGYAYVVFRKEDKREKNGVLLLLLLFFCSIPIPLLFGGAAWHFFTASLYLSILTARAICYLSNVLALNKYLRSSLLIGFFLMLSVATVRGIKQELADGGSFIQFMLLTHKALNDETLNHPGFIPQVVYYDTGSYGNNTWPFGGQGNLFKYLYRDSRIIEIPLVNGRVLKSDKHLCLNASGKKTLFFGFNAQDLSWHTIPEKQYCGLD
jgi:hypothetical protein